MAVQSPPFALQNSSHSAALFRQAAFSAMTEAGTLAAADLAVTAQSSPNMSVIVAAGRAWIPGTQVANVSGGAWNTQAAYFGLNDAPVTVTIAASNATNPRIDVIYAAVNDAAYSGASNNMVIGVVTGTPAGSPTVPALPNNAIDLAHVAVAANATTIVSGNISATPGLVATALGGITPVTSADVVPGLRVGQYRDHPTLGIQRWDGTNWGPDDPGRPQGHAEGVAVQSTPTGSSTVILMETAVRTRGMSYDPATGKLSALPGFYGLYLISGAAQWAGNATGRRLAQLFKNGAQIVPAQGGTAAVGGSAAYTAQLGTYPVVLGAGDYLQIEAFQDSGGALNVNRNACFLQATYIGSA